MPTEAEIEAAANKAVSAWMITHGYPTGHGDTLDDLLNELVGVCFDAKSKINFRAWASNAITFIRERGLEGEFRDWCGGWPCPIKGGVDRTVPPKPTGVPISILVKALRSGGVKKLSSNERVIVDHQTTDGLMTLAADELDRLSADKRAYERTMSRIAEGAQYVPLRNSAAE